MVRDGGKDGGKLRSEEQDTLGGPGFTRVHGLVSDQEKHKWFEWESSYDGKWTKNIFWIFMFRLISVSAPSFLTQYNLFLTTLFQVFTAYCLTFFLKILEEILITDSSTSNLNLKSVPFLVHLLRCHISIRSLLKIHSNPTLVTLYLSSASQPLFD